MESEFVPVSREFKSHATGRDGAVLNTIRQTSGATITSTEGDEEGFIIFGDSEQREIARKLILEKVVSFFKKCRSKDCPLSDKTSSDHIDRWL